MLRVVAMSIAFPIAVGLVAQESAPNAVPSTFRTYVVADQRFEMKKSADAKTAPERDPRDRTEKLHCFVCEHGLNPTLAILTRAEPTEESAAAKLAKGLQPLVNDNRGARLNAFVAFLLLDAEFPGDNGRNDKGEFTRDIKAGQVKALAEAVKANLVPFSLAAKKSDAVTAWGLTDEQETVVVLYNRMRIVKKWTFAAGAPSDDDIKAILAATKAEAEVTK